MTRHESVLPRVRLNAHQVEAQARADEYASPPWDPGSIGEVVHVPQVKVPPYWRMDLPHERFVRVLPFAESRHFRNLVRSSGVVRRDTSTADVIGMLKYGDATVWLTGIFHRGKYSPKRLDGLLDIRQGRDRQSHINFSVLYGHPGSIGFDWEDLHRTLEEQFAANGMDAGKRRSLVRAWTPHLRPLASLMDRLEESAFAVIFSGDDAARDSLDVLRISRRPVVTPAFAKTIEAVWPFMPYTVSPAGWFTHTRERSVEPRETA